MVGVGWEAKPCVVADGGGGVKPYLHFLSTPRHFGDVAHDVFRCHRFPGSAFSAVKTSKQRRGGRATPEPPVPGVLRVGVPGQGWGGLGGDGGWRGL